MTGNMRSYGIPVERFGGGAVRTMASEAHRGGRP